MSGSERRAIAVLFGGPSAEHDVSLVSGRAIAGALTGRGHPVEGWLVDLDGAWWQLPGKALDPSLPPTAYDDPPALGARGPYVAASALERIAASEPAPLCFPAMHGPFGEDGGLQALLETEGLDYCGSGPAASAVGMDKAIFKRLCSALDVTLVPWQEVAASELARDREGVLAELESFAASLPDPRLVVKPARLGSSIGVSIVHRPDEPPELEFALAEAFRHDDLLLVEAYVAGARELEAAVVGNDATDLRVFGPGEVVSAREFYDYEAKYRSDASRTLVHPELDPGIREDAKRMAAEVYLAIGASGFARVDFLLAADGVLFLSEINTIPGFTPISLFPMLCAEAGYDFGGTCELIVSLAIERAAHRPRRRLTRADLP